MRSMTGFGQHTAETEHLRISVTARAVNHRYLDVVVHLRREGTRGDDPQTERAVEAAVKERLQRGRVELRVEMERLGASGATVRVDEGLLEAVQDLVADLAKRGLVSRDVVLGDLLRIPDLLRFDTEATESQDDEEEAEENGEQRAIVGAVECALDALVSMRRQEGEQLRAILDEKVKALRGVLAEMGELAADLPGRRAETLRRRLDELVGEGVDEDRLAQEAAILADRSDITEELDRLDAHLGQFAEVCAAGDGDSLGKRLDFLAQEIFRELNTVGSKCRESDITRRVIDGKALCEQLREQVQNVE